jgi:DNA recombination protein RmuC
MMAYLFSLVFLALFIWQLYKNKDLTSKVFDLSVKLKGMEVENQALNDMEKAFKLLSQEALEKSTNRLLHQAEEKEKLVVSVITPVKETLEKLQAGLTNLEKERKGDHEGLKVQLKLLKDSELLLKEQTKSLAEALKNPVCRGMWGELQLKRVLEISGLLPYCDFYEQEVLKKEKLRPDVIVRLSGGRQLVIDAKAPLDAFLEASALNDEEAKLIKYKEHASKIKDHIQALSKKSYFESLENSIEFVILFLPQESLFSAALSVDPTLIELGAKNQVIIATPTTLLALLKAVAFGWKQETLSMQVDAIKNLGKELYKRVGDLNLHFARVGKSLNSAVDAYNKTLGTLESRVLVTLRKFDTLGIDTVDTSLESQEALTEIAKDPSLDQ